MTGRRGGDDLYIFDMSGRNLFQSLSPAENTRLTVHINGKACTSTERDFPLCIHTDRRCIFEDIDRRPSARQHIRRGFDHFFVEFIYHLLLLCHDLYFCQADFQRLHSDRSQIDSSRRRCQHNIRMGKQIISYQPDHQAIFSVLHICDTKTSVPVRQSMEHRITVSLFKQEHIRKI